MNKDMDYKEIEKFIGVYKPVKIRLEGESEPIYGFITGGRRMVEAIVALSRGVGVCFRSRVFCKRNPC